MGTKLGLSVLAIISIFMIGWFSGNIYAIYHSGMDEVTAQSTAYLSRDDGFQEETEAKKPLASITGRTVLSIFEKSPEISSPFERVKGEQILVYRDKIVLNVKDATWAVYTDTNSMDPVLDTGAKGLEVVPESEKNIHIGDIVSYKPEGSEDLLVHRVSKIGKDSQGWYALVKGDNNPEPDPEKVRFDQIKYVLIGVIY